MTVNPSRDEMDPDRPYDPFGPNRAHQHAEDINVWHRDLLKGWDLKPNCGCAEPGSPACTFKHKLKTIQFNGKGPSAPTLMEKRWEKDLPAYQRLRQDGLQPTTTVGCAQMEQRANTQMEVEMGHLIDKKIMPQVAEGMAMSRDLEWTPKEDGAAVEAAKRRRQEARK